MRPGLLALLRTTTFRLALAQAAVVLSFVVALLAYVYFATVGQLINDSDLLLDQEYASLERVYAEGGIRRLTEEVGERASRDGPFLYVLAEGSGQVLASEICIVTNAVRNHIRERTVHQIYKFRLNDHFAAFIATGRAINPVSKTNWEGVGVEPDVKTSADEAWPEPSWLS